MNKKELVLLFLELFEPSDIVWAKEMKMAERLLDNFCPEDLRYTLDYYKKSGYTLNSLAFFITKKFDAIHKAISIREAEVKMKEGGSTSGERNRRRIEQNSKTDFGKKSYFSLFEESE
jgi:hypothetical protein